MRCTDTDRRAHCAATALNEVRDTAPEAARDAAPATATAMAPRAAAARRSLAAGAAGAVGVAALLGLAGCGTAPAPSRAPAEGPEAVLPRPAPAGAPAIAATWEAYRLQAAQRIVAVNPGGVYAGPVPDPLLAIPVLEIELEGDGRIRAIRVLRVPTQARDTTQLAIDAVRRAAPFAPVAHLPRPWKFAEVFLFDDARRFKPRTLDID